MGFRSPQAPRPCSCRPRSPPKGPARPLTDRPTGQDVLQVAQQKQSHSWLLPRALKSHLTWLASRQRPCSPCKHSSVCSLSARAPILLLRHPPWSRSRALSLFRSVPTARSLASACRPGLYYPVLLVTDKLFIGVLLQ